MRKTADVTRKGTGRVFMALWLAVAALLSSCEGALPVKPQSGGDPYEVVVMSDSKEMREMLCGMLSRPVEGLPQQEPAFDVSPTRAEWTQATRYARLTVIVKADGKTVGNDWGRTSVRYERDAFARPQLIVQVEAPSVQALHRDSTQVARTVLRLLDHFEMKTAVSSMQRHRNAKAEDVILRKMGCRVDIPEELTSMKVGKGFVWLSDNGGESVSSICVYTHSLVPLDEEQFLRMRDSVMAKNVPGERPGMYMTTERRIPLHIERHSRRTDGQNRTELCVRGLWQMRNDAMGGPFVSLSVVDSLRGRVITAEAFVYAPAGKKRNKLKRMEAALQTLRF